MPCLSRTIEHSISNLMFLSFSINFISVVPTSSMFVASTYCPFLMEVDSVEVNQCSKPFGPSSAPSTDNDVAMIKTSKIWLLF